MSAPPEQSAVKQELARIGQRFEAAQRLAKQAKTQEDRDAALLAWEQAEAEYWSAEENLVDLFLLMLRLTLRHAPELLAQRLAEGLRSELVSLSEAIVRLEKRR